MYRSAPLYRKRKQANPMPHLYMWLGALLGIAVVYALLALANGVLFAVYGMGL